MGIEDLPRPEGDPTTMDTYQDIPGFPPEIEEAMQALRTTTTTATTSITPTSTQRTLNQQRHDNQASRLEKGFTLDDVSFNATRSPSTTQESADWYEIWDHTTPRMLGWIVLAMAGFIALLIYAVLVLCLRKIYVFVRSRVTAPRQLTDYPRALPPEPIELANVPLDNLQNVNFYEVIPVAQPVAIDPPNPAVSLSQ